MALAYGDTGGAKKNLIDSIINGTTNPPVSLPPWPVDPATGQGTLGPIPDMSGTWGYGQFGSNPAPPPPPAPTGPTGGVTPFQLATGSSANPTVASGGGMGAMGTDFAAWVAQLTPDQMAQIGGPRNAFGYWLNLANQSYAAATNTNLSGGGGGRGGFNGYNPQPQYLTSGTGDPMNPTLAQTPFTPPATPNYSGINPFLRYQTGNFGSPTNIAMRPAAPTPPPVNQGSGGMGQSRPPGAHPLAPPITHSGVTPRPIGGGPVGFEEDPPPSWMNSTLGGVPIHTDPGLARTNLAVNTSGLPNSPTGSLSKLGKGKKSRLQALTGFLLGY